MSEAPFGLFAQKANSLPIVVMGKDTSQEQKMIGVHCGAVDFLEKPLSSLRLRNIWQHTVRKVCIWSPLGVSPTLPRVLPT